MKKIDERYRLIDKEIEDTLKHWQRLLLMGLEDDLDEYLDSWGDIRAELASKISCLLTLILHGYHPWFDDPKLPDKIREWRRAGAMRVISHMVHERLDRYDSFDDAFYHVLNERPDLVRDLRGVL